MTPAADKARQRYQGPQGLQYHQTKRSIPEAAFPWIARFRADKLRPYVRPQDTVLEYGVGLGWNLAALPCLRKIGLDVGEFLEPLVRERGIEFLSDPNAQPAASVDVVICHHTLEHAWNPGEVLVCIHHLLKPGGRLLLYVPYEKERRFRTFRHDDPNLHFYSWNVQSLSNLVRAAEFEVRSAGLAPFGQERLAARWATRLRLGEAGFRVLRWMANTLKQEYEVRLAAVKPGSASPRQPVRAS